MYPIPIKFTKISESIGKKNFTIANPKLGFVLMHFSILSLSVTLIQIAQSSNLEFTPPEIICGFLEKKIRKKEKN